MIVVSDTSPLNYLAIIESVWILPQLFGEVLVPPAVARELAHPRAPDSTRELIEKPPEWLSIREPAQSTIQAVGAAAPGLGAGEIEAISLAKDLKADMLLTDERRATAEARERHHLRVTGLLGIVELAAERGLLDLRHVVTKLQATSFRMSAAVLSRLLHDDDVRRQREQNP